MLCFRAIQTSAVLARRAPWRQQQALSSPACFVLSGVRPLAADDLQLPSLARLAGPAVNACCCYRESRDPRPRGPWTADSDHSHRSPVVCRLHHRGPVPRRRFLAGPIDNQTLFGSGQVHDPRHGNGLPSIIVGPLLPGNTSRLAPTSSLPSFVFVCQASFKLSSSCAVSRLT